MVHPLHPSAGWFRSCDHAFERGLGGNVPRDSLCQPPAARLATATTAQGKLGEAEDMHKRALGIRKKAFGEEHPDVAQSFNNLASIYQDQVCARPRARAAPPQRGVVEL